MTAVARETVLNRRVGGALALAVAVIICDQITKWWVVDFFGGADRGYFPVTGFFNLVLTHNTGVSFGLLAADSPSRAWMLSGLSLAIVTGLTVWLTRQDRVVPAYAIGAIIGGAIGNVIDRLHAPGVIDFLDFHVAGWHWPAFNVADSGISVGVAVLLFDALFLEPHESKT